MDEIILDDTTMTIIIIMMPLSLITFLIFMAIDAMKVSDEYRARKAKEAASTSA